MNPWDMYFFDIAKAVSMNSKCLSRKIGAIIVKDKSIIATGYNGPARGIPTCYQRYPELTGEQCIRYQQGYKSGEGLHLCIAAHAEQNCIANAARMGVNTSGSSIYMTCEVPCKTCFALIINAGIKEIICTSLKTYDDQTSYMINHSNIKLRVFEL